MNRLTESYRDFSGYYMRCSVECNADFDCVDCAAFERLVDRLGEYEDTGLEPEEIMELVKKALKEKMDGGDSNG